MKVKVFFIAAILASVGYVGCSIASENPSHIDTLNIRCSQLASIASRGFTKEGTEQLIKQGKEWASKTQKHINKTKHVNKDVAYYYMGYATGYVESQMIWSDRPDNEGKTMIAVENYMGAECSKLI